MAPNGKKYLWFFLIYLVNYLSLMKFKIKIRHVTYSNIFLNVIGRFENVFYAEILFQYSVFFTPKRVSILFYTTY